jgi:membrane-bound lytic murein transglycosylase A
LLKKSFSAGIFFLFLFGCAVPAPKAPFPGKGVWLPRGKESVAIFTDDHERGSLREALENSLAYLGKKNSSGYGKDLFTPEKVRYSLALFLEILLRTPDPAEFARRIQENFFLWEPAREGQGKTVLLTGYFEPIISGSLEPRGEYCFPIYCRPKDLIEVTPGNSSSGQTVEKRLGRMEGGMVVPYFSRWEIDCQGVLQGKGYELVWLKDPWERFILHVQGSGQVRLPDGKILRVGFAGSNGRPYRSIGRYLVTQGFLNEEELSLGRVKAFLQKYPQKMEEVFNHNERYIFFRLISPAGGGQGGPLGALDVPLTAGRSIATDLSIFPPGALAYLISRQPVFDENGKMVGRKNIRRFVLNQDTGAAMKGPARVDLFCGSGENAGWVAGGMREEAEIYWLLAR